MEGDVMNFNFEALIGATINNQILLKKRNRKDDIRYAYKIETNQGAFCLKAHHNGFTTVKRINDTARLIEKFNKIGFYSPRYSKWFDGSFSTAVISDGKEFIVWVEEFSEYKTANSDMLLELPDIEMQKVEYLGRVSTGLMDYEFNYPSPYIMYSPFDSTTTTDEYEEFLEKVYAQLQNVNAVDIEILDHVRLFFYSKREEIKSKYVALPSSVFQSDLHAENLVISNNKIIGLIDFNLAGREKVLNYFINETAYQENNPIGKKWVSDDYIETHLQHFREKLKLFRKYYTLNDLEIDIIEDLYKVIVPYKFYPLTEIIGYAQKNDFEEVNYRLQGMKKIIDKDLRLL